jgi:ComF family protein
MDILGFLHWAGPRVFNFLFPQRCILCGSFLNGETIPLCAVCAAKLPLLEGPRCRICSQILISEQGLCMDCRGAAGEDPEKSGESGGFLFDSNYSLFSYQDPDVMELIVSYKGRKRRSLAAFFAKKVLEACRINRQRLPIVPVPGRNAAIKKRGYDQIALICREIRRQSGMRILPLLGRKGKTLEQKTLNREERAKNLCGSIVPAGNFRRYVKDGMPEEVLLLDDVFTTGSTAQACAAVLKDMGVQKVYVYTLARD